MSPGPEGLTSGYHVAKSGVLTFPPGQRIQRVSGVVRGRDWVKEGNETFFVDLSGPGGAALRQGPD